MGRSPRRPTSAYRSLGEFSDPVADFRQQCSSVSTCQITTLVSFYLRQWTSDRSNNSSRNNRITFFHLTASLNWSRPVPAFLCGRGLAWSMISACQWKAKRNADDPGNRLTSGSGIQIPAAAPLALMKILIFFLQSHAVNDIT